MSALAAVSPRRRRKDRAMRAVLGAGALVALAPLFLILGYLVHKGLGAWSWHFFASDPTGSFLGDPGGIRSALLGTVEIVAMAALLAIPAGIAVALYLSELGAGGRFAATLRYLLDVMTGVPSIVVGLFVYVTLVVGGGYAAWKGAVALAILMLPIVARSAEVVLGLVPQDLREAALALGAPRWRVVLRVVLPAAASGLVTGSLLAIARGAGETAPLLFTAGLVNGTTLDPTRAMSSLPLQIFSDVQQAQDRLQARAWGAALALVALILALNLIARLASRRSLPA
ncbi:MAG TPA: phosphate ABC transporter permease PstA [Solirubrobacteraceae bacterium]|nr:phosphate ABC transporter permease PstA [Solirubrobacteraceae bacterium]